MVMRIRTTKPEFFKHYGLWKLEQDSGLPMRVAYKGLWHLCDRSGRFEWKPEAVKLDVLPFDQVDMRQVLCVLARELYVVQYVVNGKPYGWCPTVPVHQAFNPREAGSVLPPPPNCVVQWYQRASLAQNMGAPFDEPNPLSEQPGILAVPSRQNGTIALPPQGTNGAGSVTGSNGNGLHDSSRVAHASGTRQNGVADAWPTRAHAPSLPVLTGEIGSYQEQGVETLSSETGATLSPAEQTDLARAQAGRAGEQAGALVPRAKQQQALPAIRGKRDVSAIIARLATTLDEVVSGAREPLHRDQWRRVASELVFAYWAKVHSHEGSYLTDNDKRERRILDRLRENGDDVGELLYAVDGVKNSKYHMGQNNEHTVYDGIETILRDRPQVEKFTRLARGFREGKTHPMLVKYAPVLLGLGAPDELRRRLSEYAHGDTNGTNGDGPADAGDNGHPPTEG